MRETTRCNRVGKAGLGAGLLVLILVALVPSTAAAWPTAIYVDGVREGEGGSFDAHWWHGMAPANSLAAAHGGSVYIGLAEGTIDAVLGDGALEGASAGEAVAALLAHPDNQQLYDAVISRGPVPDDARPVTGEFLHLELVGGDLGQTFSDLGHLTVDDLVGLAQQPNLYQVTYVQSISEDVNPCDGGTLGWVIVWLSASQHQGLAILCNHLPW